MEFHLYVHYSEKAQLEPDPSKKDLTKYFTAIKDIKEGLDAKDLPQVEEFLETICAFILHHYYISHSKTKLKNLPYKGEIPNGGKGVKYTEADKKLDSELLKIIYLFAKDRLDID